MHNATKVCSGYLPLNKSEVLACPAQAVVGEENGEVESLPVDKLVPTTFRVSVRTEGGENAGHSIPDHVVSQVVQGLPHLDAVQAMLRMPRSSHVSSAAALLRESVEGSESEPESPEDLEVRILDGEVGVKRECCQGDRSPRTRATQEPGSVSGRGVLNKAVCIRVLNNFFFSFKLTTPPNVEKNHGLQDSGFTAGASNQ